MTRREGDFLQCTQIGLIIVCLAAKTKYLRLGGLDNRHLFLTVLKAEVQERGAGRAGVGETAAFLLCPHMAFPHGMGRESPDVCYSSAKDTSPIRLGPHPYITSFNSNHLL